MKAATFLALLVLVALAGAAEAHVEAFSQAQTMRLGPYNAVVEPSPSPMFANSQLTMRAVFTKDGRYATQVQPQFELTDAGGATVKSRMEPDGTGYFIASVAVTGAGDYTATVSVPDGNATHANTTRFTVYPDLAVRIRTADPGQSDPFVGDEFSLAFETLDNVTLRRADKLTDLTVLVEHWSDDHATLLGQEDIALDRQDAGVFGKAHVFPEKGMYHMRFASRSGAFNYEDAPILHVYASDPPAGSTDGKDAPSVGVLALLGIGSLVALLRRR